MNARTTTRNIQHNTERALSVTITQPLLPFSVSEIIDQNGSIDNRSAIDQFIETIESLNRVLNRHHESTTSAQAVEPEIEEESLDSLLAIEASDEHDESGATFENSERPSTSAPHSHSYLSQRRDDEVTLQLNNLVLLGYISAVESFFRCLTRQLILKDEFTAENVLDAKISFGSAQYTTREMLPEALLEDMTFVTLDSVKDLLTKIIGLDAKDFNGGDIFGVLKEYDKICQLRHCIVHRLGRLGSKNAARIGFSVHREMLERKIKVSTSHLEKIAANLLNIVKSMNNHIYFCVMGRSARRSLKWQWTIESDRSNFERLYFVFRQTSSPGESPEIDRAYQSFKSLNETGSARQVEEARANRNQRARQLQVSGASEQLDSS